MMSGQLPDFEGYYHFPFITKRPAVPAPSVPNACRYVEDFLDVYGEENVRFAMLGPLNEDWLASIQRAHMKA